MSLSLNSLAAQSTTLVQLVHPKTGDVLEGATVEVSTPNSKEWQAAEARYSKGTKQHLILAKDKEDSAKIEITGEQKAIRKKVIVACTKAINGFEDFDFSKAEVEKLYNSSEFSWLYTQVDEWLSDDEKSFLLQEPVASKK